MRTRSLERLRRPVPDVSNDISRRDFITGGLSWASLLVACGSNKEARSGSDGSEEPRTFTDDRGRTVSLETPGAVVAQWRAEGAYSHKRFALILEELTETVRASRDDIA